MQVLWATNPQPNCGQCYQLFCRTVRNSENYWRCWELPAPSLNFLHLSSSGPPRLADNLQNTLRGIVWLIKNKLPPEVSIKDPSVSGGLVRKSYRVCSVSRRLWEFTEVNVSVWPCPALPVLAAYTSKHPKWFQRVWNLCCYEVFGLPEESQCSTEENTGALCVIPASPLHLLFPAALRLCSYVTSHLHMMHWR